MLANLLIPLIVLIRMDATTLLKLPSSPCIQEPQFNQGIDARLITDANMKKLAEIPIRPVRIAFDHWELRDAYENAVRTAVRNGHRNLSNYILYNFEDRPVEIRLPQSHWL